MAARAGARAAILDGLEELYPDVDCELDRETPFQLVCATILSAQCTDERVNMVTPALFRRFPTPRAMAEAPLPELEEIIRTTGFFRQKAKSLKGTAALIVERFGGEVPRTLAELVELPGVARKTANVVLGTAFGIAEGVVVDTHVQRSSMRLGLTRKTDVKEIEQDLMRVMPQRELDPLLAPAHLARPPRLLRAQARTAASARWPRTAPAPASRRNAGVVHSSGQTSGMTSRLFLR